MRTWVTGMGLGRARARARARKLSLDCEVPAKALGERAVGVLCDEGGCACLCLVAAAARGEGVDQDHLALLPEDAFGEARVALARHGGGARGIGARDLAQ